MLLTPNAICQNFSSNLSGKLVLERETRGCEPGTRSLTGLNVCDDGAFSLYQPIQKFKTIFGHILISQEIFLTVLSGLQTWEINKSMQTQFGLISLGKLKLLCRCGPRAT